MPRPPRAITASIARAEGPCFRPSSTRRLNLAHGEVLELGRSAVGAERRYRGRRRREEARKGPLPHGFGQNTAVPAGPAAVDRWLIPPGQTIFSCQEVDDRPFACHTSGRMLGHVMLDFSGERCARSVLALANMTRSQLEMHLEQTAQASASVLVMRASRPKPEKVPRSRRRDWWR